MNCKTIFLSLLISVLFSFIAKSQEKYYQYSKPVGKYKIDLDLITEFEIGFHSGRNWTIGSSKNIARVGQVHSFNLGWNNGKFYGGAEFSLKFWDQILNDNKANKVNFNQDQFLCLLHMKWYVCKGNVQPFLGVGTDLLSVAEGILNPRDDEEDYSRDIEEDRFFNYNAWFVPAVGVRCKLRSGLFGDISCSVDHSDNYDSMRLQVGIAYQPQF